MSIKNAHPEDVKIFNESFFRNSTVLSMLKKIEQYEARKQWVQALNAKKKLEDLREKSFAIFIKNYEIKTRKVDLKDVDLPDETRKRVNQLYVATYMACDIIESCVLDLNDTLHKVNMTLTVEQFDELVKLAKNVKEKLNFLERTDNYMNMAAWGDRCDDVYDFMQQKAQDIINAKESEDKKLNQTKK